MSTPGFVSAAVSTCGLLDNCQYSSSWVLDGDLARGEIDLDQNYVGPGYFAMAGIPVSAGREFDDRDRDGGALVAIVSQSVAARYFPDSIRSADGSAIASSPRRSSASSATSGHAQLRDAPVPMVYFPIRQWPIQAEQPGCAESAAT